MRAQDHTFLGRRGQHLVYGVTMREVYALVVKHYATLVELGVVDCHALAQNVCAGIERSMGIYPNIGPRRR